MHSSTLSTANQAVFFLGILSMFLLYGSTVRKGVFKGANIVWAGVMTGLLAVAVTIVTELPAYRLGAPFGYLVVSPLMMAGLTAFCIVMSLRQQRVVTVGTHVVGDTKFIILTCPAIGIPDVGALVLPTNTALRQTDPVGRLISGAAGNEAQREAARIGKVNSGKVVSAGSGNLAVGRIYYTAVFEPGKNVDPALLRKGVESAFQQARKTKTETPTESIAVPLGPLPGLTMEAGFDAVISAALRQRKAFAEVVFLVFDPRAADLANKTAARILVEEPRVLTGTA